VGRRKELSFDTNRTAKENDGPKNACIVACVFVIAVFKEPLPNNDKGIHIETHNLMGGVIKYEVEIGSVAMLYIPNFIMIGSCIQKFMGGDTHTHRHTGIIWTS
jgi:hypothetical protein